MFSKIQCPIKNARFIKKWVLFYDIVIRYCNFTCITNRQYLIQSVIFITQNVQKKLNHIQNIFRVFI